MTAPGSYSNTQEVLKTVEQAAEELSIDPSSLRRLLETGDIRYVNVAPTGAQRRSIRIEDTEIARFIAERRSGQAGTGG